ncbi:hypothetical protein B9Z65_8094 [Elsinoe australis]|uniref:Methyltransferase domain-containing protein n=1 Tax=Elsinoe australis TaxID=40998 RepID=A0A2P7YW36_9PEZI|nr:hypothetical protein B9Z65_8094 [Elsinoe australis]
MASQNDDKSTTYMNGYHPSVMKSHSWRTAENSCPHLLPTLKEMVKEKPNLHLLDIGAGIGTITLSLARHLPEGHITATDLTPSILSSAQSLATTQSITNVTFETCSVLSLPYPDASFDIVHCSQLLGHIPVSQRVQATREMLRVCRPGGRVACREMLVTTFALSSSGSSAGETGEAGGDWFARWKGLIARQIREQGQGELETGKKLRGYFVQAGVGEEDVVGSASADCWSTRGDRETIGESWAVRTLESNFAGFAEGVGISREELERIARGWREWVKDESGWFAVMQGEVLVTKR